MTAKEQIEALTKERDALAANHKECVRCLGEALQDTADLAVERDEIQKQVDDFCMAYRMKTDVENKKLVQERDALAAQLQQCREQALLDAMNATLPFDKTGRVIAAAIRSLK